MLRIDVVEVGFDPVIRQDQRVCVRDDMSDAGFAAKPLIERVVRNGRGGGKRHQKQCGRGGKGCNAH